MIGTPAAGPHPDPAGDRAGDPAGDAAGDRGGPGGGAVRVAVVGAGALGQLVAALLTRGGRAEPTLLSRRREAVDTIRAAGVTVTDPATGTSWTARPVARSAADAPAAAYDLVLLLVKSHDIEWAVELGVRVAAAGGVIVALQNGLRSAAVVEAADPRGVAGAIYLGARHLRPGAVELTAHGPLVVAEPRAAALLGALPLPVQRGADRDAVLWAKLVRAMSNVVSGALAGPVWALDRSPAATELLARARAEALDVAAARGVRLDRAALTRAAAPAAPHNVGSTYQSLVSGRPTEAVGLARDVEAAAAECGVPTPVTTGLRLLLQARAELASIARTFP